MSGATFGRWRSQVRCALRACMDHLSLCAERKLRLITLMAHAGARLMAGPASLQRVRKSRSRQREKMMYLATIKEIADLRAEIGSLYIEIADRLTGAVARTKEAAIAQFKNHFGNRGFAIQEAPHQLTAVYQRMEFLLTIDEKVATGSYCSFTLSPPAALREPNFLIHMLLKDSRSALNYVDTGDADLVREAERELQAVRAAISGPSPEFSFVILERKAAGSLPSLVPGNGKPTFATFAELLESVYPQ
jgi:hypothetical protein